MTPTRSALLAPLLLLALAACSDGPKQGDTDTACEGEDCGYTNEDADGDGYMSSVDCDDQDPAVNGGAAEVCDGEDNDCDGLTDDQDDDLTDGVLYLDADGDGYGSGVTTEGCDPYDRWVRADGDCNDTDETVNPEAAEICDEQDNDCDGFTDDEDDELDGAVYYLDEDGDGYGGDAGTTVACSLPEGYAGNDTDCDDADTAIHPGTTDREDGIDNDCDGETDEDVSSGTDVSGWEGYFIVGKFVDAWQCINYYEASGEEVSDEEACDDCDFSLRVEATYVADALAGSYEECDWADLEFWSELSSFETLWSFNYDPRAYDGPVAYYWYAATESWYPFAYMYYGEYGRGDYLQWVFFAEYDSAGQIEAGLFWGYLE